MRKYKDMSPTAVRNAVEERTLGMWRIMWLLRVLLMISAVVIVVIGFLGWDDAVQGIMIVWTIGFVLLVRHELIVLTLMMLPRTDAE